MKFFKLQQLQLTLKTLFSLSILLSTLIGFSQVNIAVAPKKMNVLYVGVDNPVSVAASGSSDEKVTVSIAGADGKISKIGSGLYNVQVSTVTDECLINVYVDGKLAGSSAFRVRALPHPIGTIGGYSSGSNIPANVFQKQAGLGLYVKDFPFDVKYEVVSFIFSVEDGKGQTKSAESKSSVFSQEAKQFIEQYAQPGRTVTIDAILAKDQSGKIVKIPALVYYIK